jgi:nicotinate-nucleotide pyrophosphorylase
MRREIEVALAEVDTRKTTPGLRQLEKASMRAGGGHDHAT